MKRTLKTNDKIPDAILTSDWHLRESIPRCWVGDFWAEQWSAVEQVAKLAHVYHCPVIHAGDLYHHWKPSPNLLSMSLMNLPEHFYTIYGQHDLPEHSMDLDYKSGIYALHAADRVEIITGSWGAPKPGEFRIGNRSLGVWHRFVWDGEKIPWPDCDELTAKQILKKFPEFDLIVTGDHHRPFVVEHKGRLLVNCGCLTRQDASYYEHQPRVWLYYAKTNSVEPFFLQIDKEGVSREHLEQRKDREQRIEAFVSRLSDDWEVSVSFEQNIERSIKEQKLNKSVKQLIYKALENE